MDDFARGVAAAYPPAHEPTAPARSAARDRLVAQIAAGPSQGLGLGPRRRVVLAVAVGAVVVALVGTATFRLSAPGETGLGRADAATVQALELGARSAEAQAPPAPLTPGRFLFTHSIGAVMNGEGRSTLYLVQTDRRSWIGADGALRLVERTTPGRLLAGSPEVWRAAVGRLRASAGPQVTPLGDAGPTILDNLRHAGVGEGVLAAHADDPAGLAALLREAAARYGGRPADQEMLTLVGDALRESLLSPDARAALFRAAAYVPGVELVGEVTDPRGRRGIAVAQVADGVRRELIFDPVTSALLAEREVVVGAGDHLPGVPAGTVIEERSYLVSRVVDSATAEP